MKIELWPCEYRAECGVEDCEANAQTLARYIDERGHFISQVEFCDEHLRYAIGDLKVQDHRRAA